MARIFTREAFHELVWSKPMTHLAKEFALSDVALHKICRKHDVPTPPVGWWARKAAGQKVERTPLPKAKTGTADRITIAAGDLARESTGLASIREQARILASVGAIDETVPDHPIVERTIARLRKAKPSDIGIVKVDGAGLVRCEVALDSIDRLTLILNRLVQAVSLQGYRLVKGEDHARLEKDGETMDFSVTEQIRREKHIVTDAERAEEEKWHRKMERESRGNSWDWDLSFSRPRPPEWDHHPTGQLSLEFEQVYVWGAGSSPRRSFRDAKVQRLENMASDIAVGGVVLMAAKVEQRLRRESEQLRAREAQLLREQAARASHVDKRRSEALGAILADIEAVERLRNLTATLVERAASDPGSRVATFLEWACEQLARRDAQLSPEGLEQRFERDQLFGDTDDHAFAPSRW